MQMKRDGAAAFVETIKGPQWGGEESTVAVNLDPGMLAAMQRAALISPAWLAACSATMGSSLTGMAVLAANNITMQVTSTHPQLDCLLLRTWQLQTRACSLLLASPHSLSMLLVLKTLGSFKPRNKGASAIPAAACDQSFICRRTLQHTCHLGVGPSTPLNRNHHALSAVPSKPHLVMFAQDTKGSLSLLAGCSVPLACLCLAAVDVAKRHAVRICNTKTFNATACLSLLVCLCI